jgi:hypothetical protein
MIVRSVNLDNLSKFDFINDAEDTIRWLRRTGMVGSADLLQEAYDNWGAVDIPNTFVGMNVSAHGTADFSGTQHYQIQLGYRQGYATEVVTELHCVDVSPNHLKALRDRINDLLAKHGER